VRLGGGLGQGGHGEVATADLLVLPAQAVRGSRRWGHVSKRLQRGSPTLNLLFGAHVLSRIRRSMADRDQRIKYLSYDPTVAFPADYQSKYTSSIFLGGAFLLTVSIIGR